MVWPRDLDLVVPLWQGGDDVRVAQGAAALARLVPSSGGNRLHVSVSDGPRETVEGVRNLQVVADTVRRLRERVARRNPQRTLTLGGDCVCDLAAIEHLAQRHEGLAVYWVDAHADLNTPMSSPSAKAHGMGLRVLLGDGHPKLVRNGGPTVPASHVTLVGTRDLDPGEEEFARSANLERLDPAQLVTDPGGVVSSRHPGTPAYVHLDMDVCDPADLPAVSCPTPRGPTPTAVVRALAAIAAHHDVVGVGVCEYAPVIEHDTELVTALLAALGLAGAQR